jgi:uncharacterized membrane protein YfcA
MDFFYYIFAGFAVGLLVGLTGVGGGSLMTPILMIFFNVKAIVAVGTDLLYASITKSVGIFAHGKLGNIDWKIVRLLAYGSIPAAIATTLYLRQSGIASDETVTSIKFWLGIALLLTLYRYYFVINSLSYQKRGIGLTHAIRQGSLLFWV